MKPPDRLDGVEELMDAPDIEAGVLRRTLLDLEAINRRLGGTRATTDAVASNVRAGQPISVLDIGCAGGDLPRAMARSIERRRIGYQLVAVDRNPSALGIAHAWSTEYDIDFVAADGLRLPFRDRSFDVVTCAMTLHHFDAAGRIALLREMARVARRRVVVNDLERCWPNYLGARLLAVTLWRRSLATHDGPRSVLRAFTADELARDFESAGLGGIVVSRRFFYRLVGSGVPRRSSAAADATL